MEDNNITKPEKQKSSFWELLKYAAIAIIIVIPFRIFIAQPYIVDGSSMDPTFKDGDYLIVDQLSKRFKEPDRESVLIIRYPRDPSRFFIKRLIAFPGETVEIKNGQVIIFSNQYPKGLSLDSSYVVFEKIEDFSTTLKEGEYFVMGDNRAGSSDSRIWGPVPEIDIVGEPILRLLPLSQIGLNPGAVSEEEE